MKRVLEQQDDIVHFIYQSSLRNTAQMSAYDVANRRQRMLNFIQEQVDDAADENAQLQRRITALEKELVQGQAIMDWFADRKEACRRLHQEAGGDPSDPAVRARLDTHWRVVRQDPAWKQRRAQLTKSRLKAMGLGK